MAGVVRPPLQFPAPARHTATVIFIHGLGDSGHGWAPAVENWRLRKRLDHVKFILPNAPTISVTANWGMQMPGWYDIASIDGSAESLRRSEDKPGIRKSQAYFHGLIDQEIKAGIAADRIVIGGFSQGGAMSLFSGLTAKVKLAGIVALSSYLVLSKEFQDIVSESDLNKETPIFMGHGDADQVVNPALGKASYEILKGLGYNVAMKTYDGMGHSACPEELDEVEAFLKEQLPGTTEQDDAKTEL